MPCYTINLLQLNFNMKHASILIKALQSLAFNFRYEEETGRLFTRGIVLDLKKQTAEVPEYSVGAFNQLKRKYSETVLDTVAQKKKWILKNKGQNQFEMRRY